MLGHLDNYRSSLLPCSIFGMLHSKEWIFFWPSRCYCPLVPVLKHPYMMRKKIKNP